jgi:uncharacterized membrane protein
MTEFTKSYSTFKGTFLRTLIYTIGHFFIAAATTMYFTGADVWTAMTNAVVEPILNAIWYFILDAIWIRKVVKAKESQ